MDPRKRNEVPQSETKEQKKKAKTNFPAINLELILLFYRL